MSVPLFKALSSYLRAERVSFHTPGHKNGRGVPRRLKQLLPADFFKMDLSSSCQAEVDSLYQPEGVIKQAQHLAALAYGADYSFFLVNGSTVGNQTMVLATCAPGEKIIIPRHAHQSIFAGLILSGADPVYLTPYLNQKNGLIYNITFQEVKSALTQHPSAQAVLITSPSYYGVTADLKKIASFVHRQKKILLVDEAHGAHLKFSPQLPLSALEAGADGCVQSTHKILAALSQGSILHLKGKRIGVRKVEEILQLLQTTSPSYIILASLDLARHQMETEGEKKLNSTLQLAQMMREEIKKLNYFYTLEKAHLLPEFSLDQTKITIFIRDNLFSGYFLAEKLRKKYQIYVELAGVNNILLFFTIGTRKSDLKKIIWALKEIEKEKEFPPFRQREFYFEKMPPLIKRMTPREAVLSKSKMVPLKKARGRVCAEIICPYPPGIPILTPGEEITPEVITYLQHFSSFHPQNNFASRQIKVVASV